jgi:hypothetical protein
MLIVPFYINLGKRNITNAPVMRFLIIRKTELSMQQAGLILSGLGLSLGMAGALMQSRWAIIGGSVAAFAGMALSFLAGL